MSQSKGLFFFFCFHEKTAVLSSGCCLAALFNVFYQILQKKFRNGWGGLIDAGGDF